MLPDIKYFDWIKKNLREAIILALLAFNIYQYKAAKEERAGFREFYNSVYQNEYNRNQRWESLVKQRSGAPR